MPRAMREWRAVCARVFARVAIAWLMLIGWSHAKGVIESEGEFRSFDLFSWLELYRGSAFWSARVTTEKVKNYSGLVPLIDKCWFVDNTTDNRRIRNNLSYIRASGSGFAPYRNFVTREQGSLRGPRCGAAWCRFGAITEGTLFIEQIWLRRLWRGSGDKAQRYPDPQSWGTAGIFYPQPNAQVCAGNTGVDERARYLSLKGGVSFGDGSPWALIGSHNKQLPLSDKKLSYSDRAYYGRYDGIKKDYPERGSGPEKYFPFVSAILLLCGVICYGKGMNTFSWIGNVMMIGGLALGVLASIGFVFSIPLN